jgi:hypothetical protein
VSRSGYYAWAGRGPSKRKLADEVLAEQIRGFHTAPRCIYGAPRIHDALRDAGIRSAASGSRGSCASTACMVSILGYWRASPGREDDGMGTR